MVRLYGLGQLVMSFSVLSEEIRWLFEARPASMLCRKVLPSRVARGYMSKSGVRSGAGTVFMASTPFLQLQAFSYAELVVKPLYCCM